MSAERQDARAWVHSAIEAQCHWSASIGWAHSGYCDRLTETKMVADERARANALLASAVLLLRRVRAEDDLPSDIGRQFELTGDIDAFFAKVGRHGF